MATEPLKAVFDTVISPVELLTELTPPIALQEEEPRERKLEP